MSRDAIIRQIVKRDVAGADLSEAKIRKRESALHALACVEFGSWETALEYAGVNPKLALSPREGWSRDKVTKRLRRLCVTGYDLSARSNRSREPALYRAGLHFHGTWRLGLVAAGINLSHVDRLRGKALDNETMVLWLQERQSSGKSLVWTEVCLDNRDRALAIRQRFGSWIRALEAAGLAERP